MIQKEIDHIKAIDKFSQAGLDAEKQMAFYLKRELDDIPDIFVLNDIRLENQDDAAQIDHLIIHKYGMIIVESKSATGRVFINDRGEWTREYKSLKGMSSPVKQAEMQSVFLRKYLDKLGPRLPSDFGIKRTYDQMPVDILVSLSNTAIIQRPRNFNTDNVLKADLVPDKIKSIIRDHNNNKGFFSFSFRPFTFNSETLKEITNFLKNSHKPFNQVDNDNKPDKNINPYLNIVPQVTLNPSGFCIHCHTEIRLEPRFPFCQHCYMEWKKHPDKEQEENYCHICGEPNKSTLNKPGCRRCYRAYKNKLEFYIA